MTRETCSPSLRVAIVKAYESNESFGQEMVNSFVRRIRRKSPFATIDIFSPIHDGNLPTPSIHDLIVITGGPSNLMETPYPSWVLGILTMIRNASSSTSNSKLVGVCWGHQAIAVALGGKIGNLGSPKVGIESISLKTAGHRFFRANSLKISKFHKLHVQEPAPGFTALAVDNEILLSQSTKILSFQGHPEIYDSLGEAILMSDVHHYFPPGTSVNLIEEARLRIREKENGEMIFDTIMDWAHEKL